MDERDIATAVLSGPDAIIAADGEGVITFWNAGAERVFGYTGEEALGSSLDLIIPERLRERHWHGWRDVMRTGRSRYGDDDLLSVPSQRQDGRPLSVEFTIHPIHGPGGTLAGIAATLRDVTARFNQMRELRKRLADQDAARGR